MKCPICNKGKLSYTILTQNSRTYVVKTDGTLSKKPIEVQKEMYLDDCAFVRCSNTECNIEKCVWDFIDGKLVVYNEQTTLNKRLVR